MIGVKKDVKSQRKVAFKDFPLAFFAEVSVLRKVKFLFERLLSDPRQ